MHDPYATAGPSPNDKKPTADFVPGDEQQPLQQIGRYRVQKVLGKGGFGIVYLAHDDQLQRPVAIKVPHRERVERPEDAEAYLNEARTVANLDYPNIVPVYDVGSTEQFPCYVVSKYIDGSDLFTRLKQSRPTLNEAVELMATVAEALHYAHKQEIVHRDIKPGNILLDKSGKPYVADFGLALREQDVGKGPRSAGTPAYMSPEQARGDGHRVDGRSDIFSLSVVFYELLTGRRPFKSETTAELLEQIASFEAKPPRQLDDTIPKELERICLKALAKRASDRYTTAKDMADDLRHWLDGPPTKVGAKPTSIELKPATPGVGKDVFLSYATLDMDAAYRICRLLEENGIPCWIAPRDVIPGADYGEAIVRAIEEAEATILFLSAHANASVHVTHEVERATSKHKRVIPICLEDVQPGPSLELHLATAHRLDAFRLSPEQVVSQLMVALRGEHNTPSPAITPPVAHSGPPVTAAPPPVAPRRASWPFAAALTLNRRWLFLLFLPVLFIPWWYFQRKPEETLKGIIENNKLKSVEKEIETEGVLLLVDKSAGMNTSSMTTQKEVRRMLADLKKKEKTLYIDLILYDDENAESVLGGIKVLDDKNYEKIINHLDDLKLGGRARLKNAMELADKEIGKHGKSVTVLVFSGAD